VTLSRESMLEVMAYVDGELDGEALDRVESLLATDKDASRLALELRTLGDCVRVIQSDRALGPGAKNPNEIADDVMKALGNNVVPIAPLAIRRRNAMIAGGISTVIGLAAAWFLIFQTQNPPNSPPDDEPVAQASVTPVIGSIAPATPVVPDPDVVPEQMAAQAAGQLSADVESIESPSHEVSVFYVPSTASANPNASSVVVWIGEGEATK